MEQPKRGWGEDQRIKVEDTVLLRTLNGTTADINRTNLQHSQPEGIRKKGMPVFRLINRVFLRLFMFLDTNEIGQLKGHCSAFKCFTHH